MQPGLPEKGNDQSVSGKQEMALVRPKQATGRKQKTWRGFAVLRTQRSVDSNRMYLELCSFVVEHSDQLVLRGCVALFCPATLEESVPFESVFARERLSALANVRFRVRMRGQMSLQVMATYKCQPTVFAHVRARLRSIRR